MKKVKINDCINCINYINGRCTAGHNYDGTVKSAINYGIDIECKQFESKN